MGSREDNDYWESKYAEAYCHFHDLSMEYDDDKEHWVCPACVYEE